MNIIEAIKTRRSIRKFNQRVVPENLLREIVDAARWAPSGDNAQPWVFVIIKDTQLKLKIQSFLVDGAMRYIKSPKGKRVLKKYGQNMRLKWIKAIKSGTYQEHVSKAPVLIVVLGNTKSIYYVHDCCAATQNLILAAHALGLGSCWIDHGIDDELTESQIRNLLNVPNDYRIVSLISLGFPQEKPEPRPRKEIGEISFVNEYGKKWT